MLVKNFLNRNIDTYVALPDIQISHEAGLKLLAYNCARPLFQVAHIAIPHDGRPGTYILVYNLWTSKAWQSLIRSGILLQ